MQTFHYYWITLEFWYVYIKISLCNSEKRGDTAVDSLGGLCISVFLLLYHFGILINVVTLSCGQLGGLEWTWHNRLSLLYSRAAQQPQTPRTKGRQESWVITSESIYSVCFPRFINCISPDLSVFIWPFGNSLKVGGQKLCKDVYHGNVRLLRQLEFQPSNSNIYY